MSDRRALVVRFFLRLCNKDTDGQTKKERGKRERESRERERERDLERRTDKLNRTERLTYPSDRRQDSDSHIERHSKQMCLGQSAHNLHLFKKK